MRPFAWIAGRWDLDADARTAMPFRSAIALLNIKRVELACLLAIVNDVIELLQGHTQTLFRVEVPACMVLIAVAWRLRRARSVRLQEVAVAAFFVVALIGTQWAVYEHAASGNISSGYLVRLLTATLLFVLPPRTLAVLLLILLATFTAAIWSLDAPAIERLNAIIGACTVTAISQLTGWLIYDVRRTDHEQRVLIESQNTRLEAQNAELDQLMAITAHDLRSPLYGLRNLFDLASRRSAQEPSLPYRALQDGIASLDAMLGLVNRLLQAHQAEHGPLAKGVDADLRDHVRAAAQRIAPLAEVHAVTVEVTLPDAALPARFDGGALAQILDNLLANAVRYTPAGQPLRLAAHRVGGDAILTVVDSGPGVDPAMRPALFRKFHGGTQVQGAPDAGRRETGGKAGSGLGLFIAATYAARIGARLSFRPGEPDGAVFELTLRLAGRD